ncbi:MAG: hypothetical protein MEQ07_07490 [Aquimonas sp.]|nr:hypothetical protein [Aquimonas sp.]
MKNRHTSILLALGLAVGYSALVAGTIGLLGHDSTRSIAETAVATALPAQAEAPPARASHASLRLRMTLPFVPAGSARAESPQEI